ncbi:ABC transporter permease [Arthrobacter sp. I2-34]|uniref:ABC transporter permease n=1 Tax=Arthrobacter hankyongi TaxID=2904801 RepID=A0ABS9L7A2_9MICC|nr:FtsX family ABC transporter permease [Arthrobacter hankyongi]MCG2622383.1 ABC transporter permease [Arthrobacter hankyongi]
MHARRFVAVGLAVVMAVGFLTATLMVNASTEASLANSIGAGFRNADLVVTAGEDGELDGAMAAAVAKADGVAEVYAQRHSRVAFGSGTQAGFGLMQDLAPRSLDSLTVVSGRLPAGNGEVAVDDTTAAKYGLAAGTSLKLAAGSGTVAARDLKDAAGATVTGVVKASKDPLLMGQPQLHALPVLAARLAGDSGYYPSIQARVADGTSVTEAKAAVESALDGAGSVVVRTADEQTKAVVAMFTGGQDQLTIILLAFALIALLVCALVVSNTFSVLVAQRTRELALLRCIGAGRNQIRRSVIVEALLVGTAASILGVLGAIGLMAGIIAVLQRQPDTEFAVLAVPGHAVAAGLLAGVVMTVLAALSPARAATAVAPLAALRPVDDARLGNRRGKVRLAAGLVLTVAGGAILALGATTANLLIALPGGALSFVGLLMCASLFVPPLVRGVGQLARPLGVPGRLAAVNAVRNPGRTSATAAALLIGVTLVTMMMTGAQTARQVFDTQLGAEYPVDITVTDRALDGRPLDQAAARTAARHEGVTAAGLVTVAGSTEIDGSQTPVYRLGPGQAQLLQDKSLVLDAGTVLVPQGSGVKTLAVAGAEGSKTLTAVETGSRFFPPLVSAAVAEELGGPAPEQADAGAGPQLWLAVDRELGAAELMQLRTDLAAELNVNDYQLSGAAIERAAFNQIIDVMLLVVTGLLAVAVLIALVGVANTLSLSVLERTRESSLLRALGLTTGQLRGMLALEAVLVAGVAALIGTVLGVLYGWLGARSALGVFGDVAPSLPWLQLAAVLAVAVVAGLLASVLPARRAARLSPVEGLATT